MYTDSVDLPTAQQICKLKKGRLAIVENETENNAIVEAIADCEVGMFWINATDIYSKGSWTSFSKDTLPFTCWDNNEPNNTNNVETYAVIKKNGKWNDLYGFYGDIGLSLIHI
ncbi:C-type lectin domain-containing protein, partial [Roseburia sp. MSJ-14]|uniref:C-type lectin domain-containing protein n=1 Tax=Roseburia sp. MSJ-14 TaxID=2841514 RepID=UPI001C11D6D5